MVIYIARRLLTLIPILLGVTLLTFAIEQVTPGDPVLLMLGQNATPELIKSTREQLGYSDPLLVQYGRYVLHAMQGDLGQSVRGQTDVLDEILARFPSTAELTVSAMVLAIIGGVTIGMIAATTRRKWVDNVVMLAALVGLSLPSFWIAIMMILVFGVHLKWVSVIGGEGLKDLILPSITLALAPTAVLARLTRSSILEVIREDYVRTALAKGLSWRIVTCWVACHLADSVEAGERSYNLSVVTKHPSE